METYDRGKKLKELREAKRLSHAELGKALGKALRRGAIGKGTVWKWEKSKSPNIELDVFFALANFYGIEPRELATGEKPATRGQQELALSPNATTIAMAWDELPPAAKEYTAATILQAHRVVTEDPKYAKVIFQQLDPARIAASNKSIESYQLVNRKSRAHKTTE